MKSRLLTVTQYVKTVFGCAVFGLGFNLFLEPNGLNAGGISGLAMVLTHLIGFGTVGTLTAVINLPLFALAGMKIGKKFFIASLLGMLFTSVSIDLFSVLPRPETEPLVGALYGGVICGFGLGVVFSVGASTGGSDIIVRLLKQKWPNVPIGTINICFDLVVAILTGLVFCDVSRTLYSGVAIFVSGRVIDAVVYRFDYSRVALIISKQYDAVAESIRNNLDRGVTFLHGEGSYTGNSTKVVLTAVKRQQLAELKAMVVNIDPEAFIIVQEAHQVLGDGFSRYSKDAL
jgi:uncharacterized membrane-anchored protein YitT (DUF2179 family)